MLTSIIDGVKRVAMATVLKYPKDKFGILNAYLLINEEAILLNCKIYYFNIMLRELETIAN